MDKKQMILEAIFGYYGAYDLEKDLFGYFIPNFPDEIEFTVSEKKIVVNCSHKTHFKDILHLIINICLASDIIPFSVISASLAIVKDDYKMEVRYNG